MIAVVLADVLAGGGTHTTSRSISVPAAQIPTTPSDPHVQDRAQITALALAYQKALAQTTHADPCTYLDPQSRVAMSRKTYPEGEPKPCPIAAEDASSNAGLLYPPGIDPTTIQFGQPDQQVRCIDQSSAPQRLPASQHGLPWAIAGWAGANGLQTTFVHERGRWWVDLLLCHA